MEFIMAIVLLGLLFVVILLCLKVAGQQHEIDALKTSVSDMNNVRDKDMHYMESWMRRLAETKEDTFETKEALANLDEQEP